MQECCLLACLIQESSALLLLSTSLKCHLEEKHYCLSFVFVLIIRWKSYLFHRAVDGISRVGTVKVWVYGLSLQSFYRAMVIAWLWLGSAMPLNWENSIQILAGIQMPFELKAYGLIWRKFIFCLLIWGPLFETMFLIVQAGLDPTISTCPLLGSNTICISKLDF